MFFIDRSYCVVTSHNNNNNTLTDSWCYAEMMFLAEQLGGRVKVNIAPYNFQVTDENYQDMSHKLTIWNKKL